MLVLSAIIHLLAFGALTGALTNQGGRLLLVILALPVLLLHLGVWASAYLFALARALVLAFILNTAWVGAGWLYWAAYANAFASPAKWTLITMMFFAPGLTTSALLIGWMRWVSPRLRGDEFGATTPSRAGSPGPGRAP